MATSSTGQPFNRAAPPPRSGPELLTYVQNVIQSVTAPPGSPTGTDTSGRVTTLTAEEGETLLAEMNTLHGRLAAEPERLALHEWIYGHKALQRAFCKYPDCFRVPAERNGDTGSFPVYCQQSVDGVEHNLKTSFERRDKLARAAGRREGTEVAVVPGVDVYDMHPVSQRLTQTLPLQLDRLVASVDMLREEVRETRTSLDVVGNPEAVLLEIDGVQHRARELIEKEHDNVLAARREVLEQGTRMESLEAQLTEANQLTAETLARIKQVEDRNTQLTTEIQDVQAQAEAQVTAAHAEAQRILEAERAAMAAELEQERVAMAVRVADAQTAQREAQNAADTARRDAADTEAQARVAVAEANQGKLDALATATQERDRALTLSEQLAQLHTTLEERQREFTDKITQLHAEFGTERSRLQDTIDRLRTQLSTQADEHRAALTEQASQLHNEHAQERDQLNTTIRSLRDRLDTERQQHQTALTARDEAHRDDLATQLGRQHTTTTAAHAEVTTQLNATIDQLRAELSAVHGGRGGSGEDAT